MFDDKDITKYLKRMTKFHSGFLLRKELKITYIFEKFYFFPVHAHQYKIILKCTPSFFTHNFN